MPEPCCAGGAVRGNRELGVVVGVDARSVLKGVRSSENGVCGFKCTLAGKLLLVACESGDATPYLRAQVPPSPAACCMLCDVHIYSWNTSASRAFSWKPTVYVLREAANCGVCVQGGSMQCQSCVPDMAAAESDGVSEEMTSDMVDDMLGDMLGAFQALLSDPDPVATINNATTETNV